MKISFSLYILTLQLFHGYSNTESNEDPFDSKKIFESNNFYQITSFISSNLTKSSLEKLSLFHELPGVTYLFDKNRQKLYYASRKVLKGIYSLQESLIVFYTSDINETESFIDFLIPHLSVRQRPKCLIIYISSHFEVSVIDVLKYAWKKKFLDFSVISFQEHASFLAYHYNPFNDVVYRKESPNEIFPDKLSNGFEYPFYINDFNLTIHVAYIRRTNRRIKPYIDPHFTIEFTTKILNLSIVKNNSIDRYSLDEFFENSNLDMPTIPVFDRSYFSHFLIPTYEPPVNLVAFVPIIFNTKLAISSKTIYTVAIMLSIIFLLFCVPNRFRNKVGTFKMFDVVLLLFGQSINYEPKKMVQRIILLSLVVTFVKLTNDFLLDLLLIRLDREEVPFETYEDLYGSKLQTYLHANERYLKDVRNIDATLTKVLNESLVTSDKDYCLSTLKRWGNVSCINFPVEPEWVISIYQNPDGSPAMKVAEPPIVAGITFFYWLASASPYASKFHEIMLRIKETSLLHWPGLVYPNRETYYIEKTQRSVDDGITVEQLLGILGIGLTVSIIVFVIELIGCKIKTEKKYRFKR